jgi:hypothetical protein
VKFLQAQRLSSLLQAPAIEKVSKGKEMRFGSNRQKLEAALEVREG